MYQECPTAERDERVGYGLDNHPPADFGGRIEGLRWKLRRARTRGLTHEEWQAAMALAVSLLMLLDEPSMP